MTAVEPEVLTGAAMLPDSVVIYDGPARTEEWFAARRRGITATDVPAIARASDYRTALHVWMDKRGEDPTAGRTTQAADAGTRLEPVIRQWWADDHGVTVLPVGVLARRMDRWMVASPDGVPSRCPDGEGPCLLEVKNRNAYVGALWREDVPDDVLAQCAWQIAVTGVGHCHVAALIGGNTTRWHRINRDPVLEEYLIGEAAELWAAHLDGVPPQVDPSSALTRLLDALYPQRAGETPIPVEKARALWRRYQVAAKKEADGKEEKAALRDEVVQLLDAGEVLTVEGYPAPLATYREGAPIESIPADEIRRLMEVHPYTYRRLRREGFLKVSTHRTLRWTKRTGESLVA